MDTCRNGHERSEANASWSGGRLSCKACNREKSKRYVEKLQAAGLKRKRKPEQRRQQSRPLTDAEIARINARFVEDSNGCSIWQGSVNVEHGYGQVRAGGSVRTTHRLMYEVHVGEVSDGLVLDHLCRNRRCGNPAHLEPVPQRVNLLRGDHPNAVIHRARLRAAGVDVSDLEPSAHTEDHADLGRTAMGDKR